MYFQNIFRVAKGDIALLSTISNQATVAIENTEFLVKTLIAHEELESRKKIEKAKGILMKEQDISEDSAYNLIRKSSMDKRVPMKEIAEALIISREIRKMKK